MNLKEISLMIVLKLTILKFLLLLVILVNFIIHSLFLNNQFVYLSINVKDFLSNHIFVIFMNVIYTPRD